ncbi:MAG: NUDIX domain-containing protein [Alphaproteobacteria bacterium]|nr:NUDIX domain-containing protein [Alphaproteobacteria bacterium]
MERIDVFYENFTPNGTATIDEVHRLGLWHQTVAYWLLDVEREVVFFQLRGSQNRVGPNTFDATASGHLSAGESRLDGLRELQEELGLSLMQEDILYWGIYKNQVQLADYINNEFCHIHFVPVRKELTDFVCQQGEVSAIFELQMADMDDLLDGKPVFVASLTESKVITIKNLCAYRERLKNGYYQQVFNEIKNIFSRRIIDKTKK